MTLVGTLTGERPAVDGVRLRRGMECRRHEVVDNHGCKPVEKTTSQLRSSAAHVVSGTCPRASPAVKYNDGLSALITVERKNDIG